MLKNTNLSLKAYITNLKIGDVITLINCWNDSKEDVVINTITKTGLIKTKTTLCFPQEIIINQQGLANKIHIKIVIPPDILLKTKAELIKIIINK